MSLLPKNIIDIIEKKINMIHKKEHIIKTKDLLDEFNEKVCAIEKTPMGTNTVEVWIEFLDNLHEFGWRRMNESFVDSDIHNAFIESEYHGIGKVVGKIPPRYIFSSGSLSQTL